MSNVTCNMNPPKTKMDEMQVQGDTTEEIAHINEKMQTSLISFIQKMKKLNS